MTKAQRWTRQPEARPDALLDAALRVFAEHGYAATTLDAVAHAAHVTKGTIYHYFENKEDLLVRALELRIRAAVDDMERSLATYGGPASGRIRFMLRSGWTRFVTPEWGRMIRLMLGEARTAAPKVYHTWRTEGPMRSWMLVAHLIDEGKADGEFRPDVDSAVAARAMTCALMMEAVLELHTSADPAGISPDRLFDASLELFLGGLRRQREPFE